MQCPKWHKSGHAAAIARGRTPGAGAVERPRDDRSRRNLRGLGRRPYAALLTTGRAFDVWTCRHISACPPRAVRGPGAVRPLGRYMFLVRPGAELGSELAQQHSVVLHGRQSWIPAPSTRTPHGLVRRTVTPQQMEWEVPDSTRVQDALVATIPAGIPYREARRVA